MEMILFCGLQASGKSSYYKENFFLSHVRVSLDLLNTRRKEEKWMNFCFAQHQSFVIDNTNPGRKERAKFIVRAKENGYRVKGYYFASSLSSCLQRNALRAGKARIPEAGIRATYNRLELPSFEEGFDELYYVQLNPQGFSTQAWKNEI